MALWINWAVGKWQCFWNTKKIWRFFFKEEYKSEDAKSDKKYLQVMKMRALSITVALLVVSLLATLSAGKFPIISPYW